MASAEAATGAGAQGDVPAGLPHRSPVPDGTGREAGSGAAGGPPCRKARRSSTPSVSTPTKYPDFVDYVASWLLAHFPASEVYGGGLRVQTTLDPTVQEDAYTAVRLHLAGSAFPTDMATGRGRAPDRVRRRPSSAAGASGRPTRTGQPGSRRLRPAPYRRRRQVAATCWSGQTITGGGSGRQPGIGVEAVRAGHRVRAGHPPRRRSTTPPGRLSDPGLQGPTGQPASACQIHNDEPAASSATETLAQATWESTNTVYAQVAPQVGCPNVATTAKKLGIESAYYSTPPVLLLPELRPGRGRRVAPRHGVGLRGVRRPRPAGPPTPILEIVNAQGKVLVNNISPPARRPPPRCPPTWPTT